MSVFDDWEDQGKAKKAAEDKAGIAAFKDAYPTVPTFLSNLGTDGSLLDQYKLKAGAALTPEVQSRLSGINLNTDPLKALETYGMGHGDSPWAQAQLEALKQAQGQAMGSAKANVTGANTAAMDAAAARGGLSAGGGENLGRTASNNAKLAGQNVIGQGLQQQGQIRSTDEGNRLNTLSQLPGMELQALQPEFQKENIWQTAATNDRNYNTGVDQANINSAMQGLNAQNQFNMTGYQQDIAKQAGAEQAYATSKQKK